VAKEWKVLFTVHLIVGLIFGLGYMLFPDLAISLFGLASFDPWLLRLVGAAVLGYTASSWFGMRQTSYERVRGIVMAEIVWTVLGALVSLMGLLIGGLAPAVWINVVVLGLFGAAFIVLAVREEQNAGVRLTPVHR
jgi:hypothetical protein